MFENEEKLEIVIWPVKKLSSVAGESKEEYNARINNAIENLEQDKGTITLTKEESEKLIKKF